MFGRREFLVGSLAVAGTQTVECASSLPQLGTRKTIGTVGELERACRTGGTFALRPGIYVLGDKVLRPVSGTHLSGTPGRTILRKSTSPGPYRTRAFFDIQDAKDVTLLGLVFDHRAARTEHAVIVRATSPGASSRIKLLNNVYRQCHVQLERFVEQVTIRDGRFLGGGVALTGVSTGGEIDKVNGKFVGRDGAVKNLLLDKLYFERTVSEAIDLNWHTQGVRATNIRCYNCDTGGVDEIIDIGGDVRTTEANQCRDIRFSNVSIVNDLPGATKTVAVQVKGRSRNVFFSNLKISRRGEAGAGSAGVRVWNSDNTGFDGLEIDGSAFGILSTARGQRVPKRLNSRTCMFGTTSERLSSWRATTSFCRASTSTEPGRRHKLSTFWH